MKAGGWGYKNIFVYYPGIFAWAKERPEKVLFWGEMPSPEYQEKLFTTKHYFEKSMPPKQFVLSAHQQGVQVVDIRDRTERNSFIISLPGLQHYPVDRLVKLIKSGSRKVTGKKMFIVDSCGSQTQWLQYVLDEHGIDYAFLKGGVVAWCQAGFDRFGNQNHGARQ